MQFEPKPAQNIERDDVNRAPSPKWMSIQTGAGMQSWVSQTQTGT